MRSYPQSRVLLFLVTAMLAACGGSTLSGGLEGGDAGKDARTDTDSRPPGSGGTCELVVIENPVLTVTSVSGTPICNATLVSAQSGGASLSPGSDCTYTVSPGGGASGSTFSIEIQAPGFAPTQVTGLEVYYCGCTDASCAAAQHPTVMLPKLAEPPPDAGSPVDASPSDAACMDHCPIPCPSSYAAATGTCAPADYSCSYAEGTCVCSNDPGGLPILGGPVWSCTSLTPGCPSPEPDPSIGTACSLPSGTVCDYGACSGGNAIQCNGGTWSAAHMACPG